MQSFLGFHSPPPADSDKEACGAIYEYLLTVKIVHRSRKSFERAAYSTPTEKVSHLGEKGFEPSVPYSQCKKNFSISTANVLRGGRCRILSLCALQFLASAQTALNTREGKAKENKKTHHKRWEILGQP